MLLMMLVLIVLLMLSVVVDVASTVDVDAATASSIVETVKLAWLSLLLLLWPDGDASVIAIDVVAEDVCAAWNWPKLDLGPGLKDRT